MSTQLLGAREEESRDDVTFVVSSVSLDSSSPNGPGLKERNYMGLSDCSSVDSSGISTASKESSNKGNLNLKATELRLGLPGSQSPERGLEHCHLSSTKHNERSLFPWHPLKDGDYSSSSQRSHVSGSKRGFSDAIEQFVLQEKFCRDSNVNAMLSPRPSMAKPVKMKEVVMERAQITEDTSSNKIESKNNNSSLPAPKAQVAGWPPIRSFMKKTLATTSKDINEVNGKAGSSALFVKVSMDGAPYLRKVDLGAYTSYQELSSALEKKFSCFTIGQCGSQEAPGKEGLSESKLKDILCGSENVLTYEDKDGDWMLVGDVPWEMFINTCRRLRIMKSSDAIGLAPRAAEKMQESEVGRISSHA